MGRSRLDGAGSPRKNGKIPTDAGRRVVEDFSLGTSALRADGGHATSVRTLRLPSGALVERAGRTFIGSVRAIGLAVAYVRDVNAPLCHAGTLPLSGIALEQRPSCRKINA